MSLWRGIPAELETIGSISESIEGSLRLWGCPLDVETVEGSLLETETVEGSL